MTVTWVPSPAGSSWAVMVALALPWPRVSRPVGVEHGLVGDVVLLDEGGRALVLGGDRPDLDLDDAAVLVALDLLELGARAGTARCARRR